MYQQICQRITCKFKQLLLSRPKKMSNIHVSLCALSGRSLAFLDVERTERVESKKHDGARPRFVEAHATRTVSIVVTEMSCAPRNALLPLTIAQDNPMFIPNVGDRGNAPREDRRRGPSFKCAHRAPMARLVVARIAIKPAAFYRFSLHTELSEVLT